MAGRGRGRSQFSFNVDALGIGRSETLPPSTHTPSPLFPPMQFRPIPLQMGEELEYMLALKQELRASTRNLPSHIRPAQPKRDVDRYSDKYHGTEMKNSAIEWNPDWSRLPRELCIKVGPQRAKTKVPKKRKPMPEVAKEEIIQQLETLEKKEVDASSEEEEEDKKEKDEEEQEGEAEDYEEELEDETDYIMSYFDNGEDFGGDSDDNMDEATY